MPIKPKLRKWNFFNPKCPINQIWENTFSINPKCLITQKWENENENSFNPKNAW